MNWLEFWSKLIDSIAWPLAVVVLVLILKNKIGQLSSFRYKETEAVFEVIDEEVDHLKEVELNSTKSTNWLPNFSRRSSKLNMILLSWQEVEAKINKLCSHAGVQSEGLGFTMHQIQLLIDNSALPNEIYDSISFAKKMQISFLNRELPLDRKTLRKYKELCDRLVNIIDSNIQKLESSERPSS